MDAVTDAVTDANRVTDANADTATGTRDGSAWCNAHGYLLIPPACRSHCCPYSSNVVCSTPPPIPWPRCPQLFRKMDPSLRSRTVGTDVIQPFDVVWDLEVYFDSHLTMKAHLARVVRTCFFHLRRLRSIRRSLGRDVTARLASALVIS